MMLTDANLLSLRQQFPALTNKHYFNYGGQGPLPQSALDAIAQSHQQIQVDGPFSAAVNNLIQREGLAMRQTLASLLKVPTGAMTLTENVTIGCNIPLWGMDWQAGDRILMTDCEHPGIVATVQEMSRRFHVEVDICPLLSTAQSGDPLAVIEAGLHPRTRMLIISHIVWNTGQVLPLAEIVRLCHDHTPEPVWVLVDAAQSVGVLPLDLAATEVDFYGFTGHKWCCGPGGLGGLYVRPALREAIAPTYIGWRSILKDAQGAPTDWKPNGERYEVATSDYPLMAGLQAAIALHEQWGTPAAKYRRICTLSEQLWQQLNDHPRLQMVSATPPPSGLVSFQILEQGTPSPGLHVRLVSELERDSCMLRTLLFPHCIRACVHYFTLESEVETLGDRILQWLDDH